MGTGKQGKTAGSAFGAEIIVTAEGVGGETRDDWTVSWLSGGQEIVARATICATGVEYSRLGLVNEEHFLGRGLFYGAGSSEASRCTGRVFIVGGGNSAGQAALNFSRFATTVTMLVRGESLKETLSSYLVEQIEGSSNIEVLINTTLVGLDGADSLESITYRDDKSGEVGMLPLIGFSPVSEAYRGQTGQNLELCSLMPQATF